MANVVGVKVVLLEQEETVAMLMILTAVVKIKNPINPGKIQTQKKIVKVKRLIEVNDLKIKNSKK
jgi:hypothetical protein